MNKVICLSLYKSMIKNYLIFIFTFSITTSFFAQDTIYKIDKKMICAKVEEISETNVSYKRCEMLDGPLYVISKNDIQKIKYKNGVIDTFRVIENAQVINAMTNNREHKSGILLNSEQIQKSYRPYSYKYHSAGISHKSIFMMSFQKNREWNDKELSKEIMLAKDSQKKQYYYGFGGPVIAIIGLVGVSRIQLNSNRNAYTGGAIVLVSAGVFIASQVISKVYKKQRLKHTEKVVDLYNSHY
jgi:hypothetical protein